VISTPKTHAHGMLTNSMYKKDWGDEAIHKKSNQSHLEEAPMLQNREEMSYTNKIIKDSNVYLM